MAVRKTGDVGGQGWNHQVTPLKNKRQNTVTLAAVECMKSTKGSTKSLRNRAECSSRDPDTTQLFTKRAYRPRKH